MSPSGSGRAGRQAAADPGGAKRSQRYLELDALRFLAAVSVVAFHFLFRASTTDPQLADTGFADPGGVFRYGYLGVELFFVTSGFVILSSVWRKSPSAFVASRIGRLYPAFWVACTLTAVVVTVADHSGLEVTFGQWLVNLTMVSEEFDVRFVDGVYWTLVIELKFYLLVFGLCLVGVTSDRVLVFGLGWLGVSAVEQVTPLPASLVTWLQPDWAPYFVAGMVFALVAREGWTKRYAGALLLAGGLTVYRSVKYAGGLTEKYDIHFSPAVVATVAVVILVAFAAIASGAGRLLGDRPWLRAAAWLGGLTYPLYLLHENIGFVLFELGRPYLPRTPLLVVVLLVIGVLAWLLHTLVENRFARPVELWIRRRWDLAHRILTGPEPPYRGLDPSTSHVPGHGASPQWTNMR